MIRPTAIALLDPARSARPLVRESVPKAALRPPVPVGFRQYTRGGWQDARRGIMAGQFPDFRGTNHWQVTCFIQTQLTIRGTSLLEIFSDWSLLLHMQRLCYFARGTESGGAAESSSRGDDANAEANASMRKLLSAVRTGSDEELARLRSAIDAVQAAASASGEAALKSIVSECDAKVSASRLPLHYISCASSHFFPPP